MRRLPVGPALCLLALFGFETAHAEAHVLSLAEALRLARSQSPVLKKAAAQSDAAGARSDTSRARLLPQILGSGSYQHTTDNFVPRPGFVPNSARAQPVVTPPLVTVTIPPNPADPKWDFVHSYNFSVVASQLVYDFGAIESFRAEREDARAQGDLERAALLNTEFAVRNAFFLARAQRALVHVAQETLANQEKHLTQVQGFVEVGTRPEIDLAQTRMELANTRVQLLRAQNAYATTKENLKLVMGTTGSEDYEVNDDTLPPLPEETEALSDLLPRAHKGRPEISALSRQLNALSLRSRAAKGRFGPALNANAGASKAGIELGDLTTNVYVGATLSWNLLQGGAAWSSLREAKANELALEADLSALEQRIRVELEQARLTIQAAKSAVEAASEAQLNARARLGLAEGRYEAGVGNAIELGDAQLALTSAEAQRVQSEYTLAIARAQLLSALGKSP